MSRLSRYERETARYLLSFGWSPVKVAGALLRRRARRERGL